MRAVISVLFLLPFLTTTAFAERASLSAQQASMSEVNSERISIVFDASGSMWGPVGSDIKINVAKKVVSEVLGSWKPGTQVGLTVYGHRKKGDCNDIETLISSNPLDRQQYTNALEGITPKGKTPLTAAVKHAAEELKYTEGKATVILVSDGLETCGANPCDTAKQLEKYGVDFTAHVIGFDLAKENDLSQLKCIAEETGGKFLTADNADTLKASFEETVAAVQHEPAATSQGMVKFVAVNELGGEAVKVDRWDVYTVVPEGSMSKPMRVDYKYDMTPEVTLAPGTYEVRTSHEKAKASKRFEVVQGQLQTIEVQIDQQGLLKIVAVNEAGGSPLEKISRWEAFTIVDADSMEKPQRVERGYQNGDERYLVPGKYRIDVSYQKASGSTEVEILPGKLNMAEVVLPEQGMAKIVAVNEVGGTPLDRISKWEIFELLPTDSMKKPKRLERGYRNGDERYLMPAKYLARLIFEKATAEQEFEINPGKLTTVELVIPKQGKLKLSAVRESGGEPVKVDRWEIYTSVPENSSESSKRVEQNRSLNPEFTLLPGHYTARARLGRAEWTKSVEVTPDQLVSEELVITEE
jgi:Ca-activated chloride channel family protein